MRDNFINCDSCIFCDRFESSIAPDLKLIWYVPKAVKNMSLYFLESLDVISGAIMSPIKMKTI